MKRKLIVGLSLIGIPLLAGLGACSHPHFGHHCSRKSPEKHVQKIADKIAWKLDMTDDQKVKLDQLADKVTKKIPEFRENKKNTGDAVLKQFESETFNRKEMEEVSRKNSEAIKDFQNFALDSFEEFHSILTTEQRKKVAEKIKDHRKHIE